MLSVIDDLRQLNGVDDCVSAVDAHIARGYLVDEDYLAVIVAELKLDVPEVEAEGL